MRLFVCVVLAACVLSLAVAADDSYKPYLHKPQVPDHPEVKLYGSYSTSLFPGAATYSLPLAVPPGTNGLAPSLSIVYNNQRVKERPGVLGAGWSLTKDSIVRDVNGTVSDVSDDFFVLMIGGEQEDVFLGAGGYVTEHERYWRIENFSTYWRVTMNDGTQYRFGFSPESRVASNTGNPYTTLWNLDEIRDTHNNTITYTYLTNPFPEDVGAQYLDRISYNRDHSREIVFSYENATRPDRRRVYVEGTLLEESRRLTAISVLIDDVLVRSYRFNYTQLSASLSSLGSVQHIGSDNVSVLYSIGFDYYDDEAGYVDHTDTWIPPNVFSSDDTKDFGVRLVDLNNDGYVDIIKGRNHTGEYQAWLNDKVRNWTNASWFAPPVGIAVAGSEKDDGVRFADVNNDGFVDLLYGTTGWGGRKEAYLNTGSGWVLNATWAPPFVFIDNGDDNGVQIIDLNGDGRVDLVRVRNLSGVMQKDVMLNSGSGWVNVSSEWSIPEAFIQGASDVGTRVVDVNGDGLPDILKARFVGSSVIRAWLNTGAGFVDANSTWGSPVHFVTAARTDNGVRFADVNGDGLVDLLQDYKNSSTTDRSAWLNTGNGWVQNDSWQSPEPFTVNGKNNGRRIADINGDGVADVLVTIGNATSQYGHTWTKNSTHAYLLQGIVNEFGGSTTLLYNASTRFDNTGGDNRSDLGFAVYVVGSVAQENGLSSVFPVTNYTYSGGKYDSSALEFRGFSTVNESFLGKEITHYFHQDDVLKGREFRTEVRDSSGTVFSVSHNNFTVAEGESDVALLAFSLQELYDGMVEPRVTQTSFSYDAFGNVVEKWNHGDVNDSDDDRFERFSYVMNEGVHLVDRIASYQLYSSDNETLVKQTRYSYDDGFLSIGDLTRLEEWNENGENHITRFDYDAYGNVVRQIDPLGRVTRYEFGLHDFTYTFQERMVNALGHVVDFRYDRGTGNVLSQEKNGIVNRFFYDVFGRKVKDVLPGDSSVFPTTAYTYSFDGVAPESVIVTKRETGNSTVDARYFYDGFGNLVQLSLDADPLPIVKNLYYDSLYRVVREDNPYFGNGTVFSVPLSSVNFTTYTYDALDRVVSLVHPDGRVRRINFSQWEITDFDENGHRHTYALDGFGQIISVLEYNNDPVLNVSEPSPYNTTYVYDAQGNLILITDALGHDFSFTYDSLGRKISMDDPDLGVWTYGYDAVGNLVRQRDNRGNAIDLLYDDLNRVVRKNGTNTTTVFFYDTQFQGTLANYSIYAPSGNDSYLFTYDDRMRVVQETQFLDAIPFTKTFTYDSMNRPLEVDGFESLEYFFNTQGNVLRINDYINSSSYNPFGSLTNRTYANWLTSNYEYNSANNRLERIHTSYFQDLRYTYDPVGNILSYNDVTNDRLQQMTYDHLDRLATVNISGATYAYNYDALGRILRTQTNSTVKRYLYKGNQLHAPSKLIERNASLQVHAPEDVDTESKTRVYQFFLVNERNETTNSTWSLLLDGQQIDSGDINVSDHVMVLVEHNYSSGGLYVLNLSSGEDRMLFDSQFGLTAPSLKLLSRNISVTISEFVIDSDINETIVNVNWTCNGVSANELFNVSGSENALVFIEYNHSSHGETTLNCTATSDDGTDAKTTTFSIPGFVIEAYDLISMAINSKIAVFDVKNYYHPQENVTINLSTGDATINSSLFDLSTDEFIMVIEEFNYSSDGEKNITVRFVSTMNALNASVTDRLNLEALKLDRYNRYDDNTSTQILWFDVTNQWTENLSTDWNLSDPVLSEAQELSPDETLMVFVENTYSQGEKSPVAAVASSGFEERSFTDWFNIRPLNLLSYQIIKQALDSTVAEFRIVNYDNATNVSWSMEMGTMTITSEEAANLNTSEELIVLVETSYPNSAVHITTGSVNSSQFDDNATGVATI